jgi:hypothetical protein
MKIPAQAISAVVMGAKAPRSSRDAGLDEKGYAITCMMHQLEAVDQQAP